MKDNGHTLVVIIPVSCTHEPLEEEEEVEGAENKEILVFGITSTMNILLESGVSVTADSEEQNCG